VTFAHEMIHEIKELEMAEQSPKDIKKKEKKRKNPNHPCLDLDMTYYQVRVNEKDISKMAFTCL
jgi:hypothetical protein